MKNLLRYLLLILLAQSLVFSISCKKDDEEEEEEEEIINEVSEDELTFTDSRDGQVYTYTEIDSVFWMTQNLNFASGNSWYYDDNSDYADTYGRLYDFDAALNACPVGWHLPSGDEWQNLVDFLGGSSAAGGILKEEGTDHWISPNQGATDGVDFTARPGGYRDSLGNYDNINEYAYFWTSDTQPGNNASVRLMYNYNTMVDLVFLGRKSGFSIRCVKN